METRGAEALLTQRDTTVVKERISKAYRIRQIDEPLRRRRTKLEARLIREARRAGVATPQIIDEQEFSIRMEFIGGRRVKEFVNAKNYKAVAQKIGQGIAQMHNYDIIHGDLTTSNMIISDGKERSGSQKKGIAKPITLYFIDFGLGFISRRPEDKATDLHLLKEAIVATHFSIAEKFWTAVLNAYSRNYTDSGKVIKALHKIEMRGRYVER